MVESSTTNDNNLRSTKRKLEDAFQVLDDAVNPTDTDRPSPPKRSNTIRSLYSTLAKYGIKSKETRPASAHPIKRPDAVNSTPHLTAILTRAASKTKSTFSFRFPAHAHNSPAPALPATAEYRPSSLPSFLSRLATYKLTTYANKPSSIDAVAASKCGWINDGKDRLVCGLCNASWVVVGREGLNRDAANALIEKQRVSLVESHKLGCPWRTRQCDDSVYCISLQSPAATIRAITSNAVALDTVIKNVSIKHPLTQSQVNALCSAVSLYISSNSETSSIVENEQPDAVSTQKSSQNATLASLFGWVLVPSPALEPLRRASTTLAISVAPPPFPTPSLSPSLSRASSVSLPQVSPKLDRHPGPIKFSIPSNLSAKPDSALLHCELCQRRIGLWAFATRTPAETTDADHATRVNGIETPARLKKPLAQRSFDLLKEHRSYCPYVVRSTFLPSLPVPQTVDITTKQAGSIGHISNPSLSHLNGKNGVPGVLEGWRAVLTVALRYGMAQRQRIEYNFLARGHSPEKVDDQTPMDVDDVKAMVAVVKSRGGKDLLRYVRGLLG